MSKKAKADEIAANDIVTFAPNKTEIGALELLTINPKEYVAKLYQPFNDRFAALRDEADKLIFNDAWLEGQAEERAKYTLVDLTTTAGMALAIKMRAGFRDDVRLAAEAIRKVRKAPILEIGRLLDGEYKVIETSSTPYENRFDKAIKAEEGRKEAIRLAKEKAEAERLTALRARVTAIIGLPASVAGAASVDIFNVLRELAARDVATEGFAELANEALAAVNAAGIELNAMYEAAQVKEKAEADRLAEIEAQRVAMEAQTEANRIEAERLAEERRVQAIEDEARRARAKSEEDARVRVANETRRQLEAQQAEVARVRQQQEAETQKTSMVMEQISAIQHQLLVAEAGRAPYCKGADIESYEFALKGTRDWVIDEANFGALAGVAELTKANVIAKLETGLAKLQAEAVKQEEAAYAEAARIAAEAAPAAPEPVAEVAVEVEPEAAPAPAVALPPASPAPGELVDLVASTYCVSPAQALIWLIGADFAGVDLMDDEQA